MDISKVSLPEIYLSSNDFRRFVDWFSKALTKVQYDTENVDDLYDPLRVPSWLIWMLADTMGFKYDDRLPAAFNRLVLMYFMSMIRNKGSKDGVTLAAETNLAQFNILEYGKENDILYNRLEDTTIPINSAYVTPHVAEGYIDVVYFSDRLPIDACIEYVRPLGMYLVQNAGVRFDARDKISIDARLTNTNDIGISIGATHVGHYSRTDYARMQRVSEEDIERDTGSNRRQRYYQSIPEPAYDDQRSPVYYRNGDYEVYPSEDINPGYRALYSLQLSNNEHIVKSLIHVDPSDPDSDLKERDPIFGLGFGPQDVTVHYPDDYVLPPTADVPKIWNLRYDKDRERNMTSDVYTDEDSRTKDILNPRPAVNPVMSALGDAMSLDTGNTQYAIRVGDTPDGGPIIEIKDVHPDGDLED